MLKQIIGQKPEGSDNSSPQEVEATTPAAAPSSAPPSSTPSKQSTPRPNMSGKNVLSSDVEIKGSLKFSNDLIIDGHIEGEVSSDGSLTVGENARINGEIKTKSVTIFGQVKGNVTVGDRCELKSNASLEGDIVAGTLSIEEGATFMGQSSVGRRPSGGGGSAPSGSKPPQGGQGGGGQKS